MPDPITTEDLYGKSLPAQAGEESPKPHQAEPLKYEETPIIEPIHDQAEVVPPARPRSSGTIGTLGTILFFILLFALGVWLSTIVRRFVPSGIPSVALPTPQEEISQPTLAPQISTVQDPFAAWISYQVIGGSTVQPISGISFKLPPEVLAPICDGANCASQGTYLPGGTRFTIAARGAGQQLSDFRGSQLVDVGGRPFTMKETTVAGKKAIEFTGLFTGTTVGGYAFNQMRGVMIEVDETLALEVNHFTPGGVNADFASDDNLFNRILESLSINSAPTP